MGFNSFPFLLFFPVVFFLYWFVLGRYRKGQNGLILVASYTFYGFWDYRFLSLIFISTITDYVVGHYLYKTESALRRKGLMAISLVVNLGMLFFFKYFGFFVDSWVEFWSWFGIYFDRPALQIILPVGISFYTFQTLSYTIDIYRKELTPCRDFVVFAAFVSFFPQLLAGPIERAKKLIPQFERDRVFEYKEAVVGMRFILWGLFKKVVVADQCALIVTEIFGQHESMSALAIFLACLFYSIQIYADFSGYSEMAIGLARLLGFRLSINFAYPFFAETLPELWKRWHITLIEWYKDYIYIPLGGSRVSVPRHLVNLMIVFTLTGLWHGASWNKVIWGVLSGLFLIPNSLYKRKKRIGGRAARHPVVRGWNILRTLVLFSIPLIIFRCSSMLEAKNLFESLLTNTLFGNGLSTTVFPWPIILLLMGTFIFEWIDRDKFLATFDRIPRGLPRLVFYNFLILAILAYSGEPQNFFYFQF